MSLPERLTVPVGKEAELYRDLSNGKVQCTACARLCQIGEGQVGLCGVRGVVGGKLYLLVYGKVIAGHIDPIEKKPVVHYRPGSKIFSLATTGCNWLCRYCFAPETSVVTNAGIKTIEELYNSSEQHGHIGYPRKSIEAISHTGIPRRISKVFRHPYSGDMVRIRPYYLPEIRCTPNHNVFVFDETKGELAKKRADQIRLNDLLAIPNLDTLDDVTELHTLQILREAIPEIKEPNSKQFPWMLEDDGETVRFKNSRGEGIPRSIKVGTEIAELLGIYCAEGSATRSKNRPNSWVVTFSFGAHEHELIYRTEWLMRTIFKVQPRIVHQDPETRVEVSNNALGIFFATVAGHNKYTKKVPKFLLFHSSKEVLSAFLDGYMRGDGFDTGHGNQAWRGTTSVSKEMTLGAWYVESRLGLLPRFYVSKNDSTYVIQGRSVNRHNDYVTRMMTRTGARSDVPATKIVRKEGFNLVPVRAIDLESHTGYVYNLEVEEDHSYCASFVAVSNCQNADISQRRKVEGVEATPEDIVSQAQAFECEGLAYTYNQPTIFMEYARDVGKIARSKGLFNIFVTNGYDTPETVAMMDEFLDCATVDFKGSGETGFVRRYIGIPNAEPIFQSLLELKRRGKVHTEITDLIVPEVGDSLEAATKLCNWVYDNLGPDVPVHFLRFHPDYKMMDLPLTPVETLEKHVQVGRKAGLNYVYIGNVPGHPDESTYCPGCRKVLIKRYGYDILEYNLDGKNRCSACGYQTPIVGPLSTSSKGDRFLPVIN
jgi:pyruvate formate lyase activating enzyme